MSNENDSATTAASGKTKADWAILFDWDGVIIESAAAHEESWELLGRELGLTLPEGHFKRGFGMRNQSIIPDLLAWTHDIAEIERISLRKEELYREVIRRSGVDTLPGVREFLAALRENGVPCIIASSTVRLNITTTLEVLGIGSLFDGIISSEDVTKGKPNPEPFLKAAARLGYAPERSVVFEDSFMGITAGKAGGMKVVGVATTHPREVLEEIALPDRPDIVVTRLDEHSPAEYAQLLFGQ
ncbi:MAG: HAD family hydrolase [Candidatus Methylacidiphilales bacterium]|nr:HAD family phosphatase [Candidatus Methylacidiphilales bacterium]